MLVRFVFCGPIVLMMRQPGAAECAACAAVSPALNTAATETTGKAIDSGRARWRYVIVMLLRHGQELTNTPMSIFQQERTPGDTSR